MGKTRNLQSGFTAVEALLLLIFLAIVAFIGVYVAHNRSNKTTANIAQTATDTKTAAQTVPKTHTANEAVTFTQKTYDDFLAAINNAGANNTQPLGQVGLQAVKDDLSADMYAKAAASQNASNFSCAGQFAPSKYTASLASSDKSSAVVALTISNGEDGSTTTTGMQATVDLNSLKITAVACPN